MTRDKINKFFGNIKKFWIYLFPPKCLARTEDGTQCEDKFLHTGKHYFTTHYGIFRAPIPIHFIDGENVHKKIMAFYK